MLMDTHYRQMKPGLISLFHWQSKSAVCESSVAESVHIFSFKIIPVRNEAIFSKVCNLQHFIGISESVL